MTAHYLTVSPPDEADAVRRADRNLEGSGELGREVLDALEDPDVREAVHILMHGLAQGHSVRVQVRPDDDYSPQEAADALGVSRKLVNKLVETGQVKSYQLPGSSHTKIFASEVDRLLAERERMRVGVDEIVDGLVDGGAEY